jgi:hypothetical protein
MKEEVEVGSVTAIHRRTTINKTPLCALRPLCETDDIRCQAHGDSTPVAIATGME